MLYSRIKRPLLLWTVCILLLCGCQQKAEPVLAVPAADLVIFTCQEESVYEPIIKEYQERSGLLVKVVNGTFQELQQQIDDDTLAGSCDVVFGVNTATLEHNQSYWQPYRSPEAAALDSDFVAAGPGWTPFSAVPLVIMYNTKVVTYRELPTDWQSLLEPRWQGRIAFMNPEASDIYLTALVTAMHTAKEPDRFVSDFIENIDYMTYDSLTEVTQAIADGRSSVGVTMEEMAEFLRRSGADVDYIYPESGTCVFLDGSAIVSGSGNQAAAESFIDFTISSDVQRILSSDLKRRSVRQDIAPQPGLKPIRSIAVYPLAQNQLELSKTRLLEEWRRLFELYHEEGR